MKTVYLEHRNAYITLCLPVHGRFPKGVDKAMSLIPGKRLFRSSLLIALSAGLILRCAIMREKAVDTGASASLIREAVGFYARLHPLRSSRLGLYQSDSLLFTFSPEEVDEAAGQLDTLLAGFTGLPRATIDERRLDDLKRIVHWLKGEQHSFGTIRNHRRNPLLYCWMLEEALFGIPSRAGEPYEGEHEAYTRRISRIPRLLGNAALLLDKPAHSHLALARERLDGIMSRLPVLEARLAARYGQSSIGLDSVITATERFRSFISNHFERNTGANPILGTENLMKMFLYDELLDLDPNAMVERANSSIRKLVKRAASARRSLELKRGAGGNGSAGNAGEPGAMRQNRGDEPSGKTAREESEILSMLDGIDGRVKSEAPFANTSPPLPEIVQREHPTGFAPIPANPYLTVPLSEPAALLLVTPSPFAPGPCRNLIVSGAASHSMNDTRFRYELLGASAGFREIGIRMCEALDTVGTIIASRTYREGCRFHHFEIMLKAFPAERHAFSLLLAEEKIRALARMVVVFRLHAGTLTSETAVEYLVSEAGLHEDEAAADVLAATVNPSIAYPGISIIHNAEMVKKVSFRKGVRKPQQRISRIFHDNPGVPLSLIRSRIEG